MIYKRRGNFSNNKGDKRTSRSPNDNIYPNLFAFQFVLSQLSYFNRSIVIRKVINRIELYVIVFHFYYIFSSITKNTLK